MKMAKKHMARINYLLNSERVAYNCIAHTDTSDSEQMERWVKMGWENAQALQDEYGIVSCAGSLRYWESMRNHFVPLPKMTNTVSPTYYGA
jgi:hypothetical protein